MIPGTTSKLSESTVASATSITAKTDVVLLTGTTTIETILPNFGGGFGGFLVLVPIAGSITFGITGNIAIATTMTISRAVLMVYVKSTGKWYPGAIS
jgi:hypothetical protein